MTGLSYRSVPNAIEVARQRGHQLVNDPPHELSKMGRMTCSVCGDAVLFRGDDKGYGSATERDCRKPEGRAFKPDPTYPDQADTEAATRYIATFSPQAWQRDYAVPVDAEGPTEWDATAFVERLVAEGSGTHTPEKAADWLLATLDHGDHDDLLWQDPAAPEWIREWRGPFDTALRKVRKEEK